MSDTPLEMIKGASLEALLRKYLTDHSSRRLNFLYWNATDMKSMILNFVNLSGAKLTRINNNELVYRLVRIKNAKDWNILYQFITQYVIDPEDTRAVFVIRVDFLLSYMKTIDFDPDKISLERGNFGVAYCHHDEPERRRPLCIIDSDIQSLYLIDKLYTKYRKLLYADIEESKIVDITESYLQETNFKYRIEELKIAIPVTEALDIVAKKFVTSYKNIDPGCILEQIYFENGLSTVVSRLTCTDLGIITVRVYMQLFLKKYSTKGKKHDDRTKQPTCT